MKNLWRAGMLLGGASLLVACVGHSGRYRQQFYWRHAQVIPPVVVPSDIRVKPALAYYPAPHMAVVGEHRPPSLIPPGSKIEYYRHLDHMKNRGSI